MHNLDELQSWHGRDLIDRDGDKIGSIGDVYLDDQTGQPEWLTVKTGLFGTAGELRADRGGARRGRHRSRPV